MLLRKFAAFLAVFGLTFGVLAAVSGPAGASGYYGDIHFPTSGMCSGAHTVQSHRYGYGYTSDTGRGTGDIATHTIDPGQCVSWSLSCPAGYSATMTLQVNNDRGGLQMYADLGPYNHAWGTRSWFQDYPNEPEVMWYYPTDPACLWEFYVYQAA